MRILCISGVWCLQHPGSMWSNIGTAFTDQFPDAELVIAEEHNLHPWEFERMRRFCDHLVHAYDDGMETLLVGHSMGGIIACAIAKRFKKTRIHGIVTIFSPHTFLGGVFPMVLSVTDDLRIPIISFGAVGDILVWWGTRHPESRMHQMLWSTHLSSLINNSRIARIIAVTTKCKLFDTTHH